MGRRLINRLRHFARRPFYTTRRAFYVLYTKRQFGEVGKNLVLEDGVDLVRGGRIRIGDEVFIGKDCWLYCTENGRIDMGDHVYLGRGTCILADAHVTVGNDSLIGQFNWIQDVNHSFNKGELIRKQKGSAMPITIGDDVWTGAGCVVLRGVTIGDGAVVGANSVVNKSIEPYKIAVGSPAKVIKDRE